MSASLSTATERRLRGRVHLWVIPVGHGASERTGATAMLDAIERDRARRFTTELLRWRYQDAHVAVRCILARYAAMPPDQIRYVRTETDKPMVAGLDLAFNLSHSGPLAVCAIAERGDVGSRGTSRTESRRQPGRIGVDIEAIRPVDDADGIVRRFFAMPELAEYERFDGDARRVAFFRLWTLKEAFVKATGDGLLRSLDSFAVLTSDDGRSRLHAQGGEDLGRWCLKPFTPAPGYLGAVTLDQEVVGIDVFQWTGCGGVAAPQAPEGRDAGVKLS
jgi:4'-phosphopantetheinyl transferase